MNLSLSIVICTYNNSPKLKRLLDCLLTLDTNVKIAYEIIIIDNNSSDSTEKVVNNVEALFYGKLRYCLEKEQGLSYARNSGIREAKGDYIAFIDDDVTVNSDWLIKIAECLERTEADLIAGRVLPKWGTKKPSWLTERLYRYLGLLDYGDKPFRISTPDKEIVGANFIVKRNIFENQKYLFKIQLGRIGRKCLSGEEIALFYSLLQGGYNIWYCPVFALWHNIPKDRMTIAYFLKWNYYHGHSEAYLRGIFSKSPLYSRKIISKQKFLTFVNCIKTIDKSYVELAMAFCFYIGFAKQKLSEYFTKDE